jgi:signal transduction histidine kinase
MVAVIVLDGWERAHAQRLSSREDTVQRSVLVLFGTGRDTQISVIAERELPQLLNDGDGVPVDYNSEYFDTGRFPETVRYQTAFREFLKAKYGERRFDLIMTMRDDVLEFLTRNKDVLFPGTPVVFFSTRPVNRPFPESTGVIAEPDFARTLDLATQLQPDTNQVFVVSGAGDADRQMENRARTQFLRFQKRLNITYLSGLPTPDLDQRLSSLPSRSVVYYLIVYQDGLDERYNPLEYLDHISAIANRPIYSWVDSTMGRGVLGGTMQDQQTRVRALASLARRVLDGEAAGTIPISTPDLHVSQIDWRQLRRWGINEERIPAGTRILFRERGIWEQYKSYVLGATVLLLAQTLLIAGLLAQAARRRAAEEQARQTDAALRTSYDRIRDLGSRLLSAQEAERSRIARELHDDVSQQTAILAVDLQTIGDLGAEHPDSKAILTEALKRSQTIARTVHDLAYRLHPVSLRLIGLVASLNGLQRDLARPDLRIAFSHMDVPDDLPHDVTLCFFRIAQEALQNAVKHGHARHIWMTLTNGSEGLTLTITDDGVGFNAAAATPGLGLISMRERLDPLGGILRVESIPGRGTSIQATVPSHKQRDSPQGQILSLQNSGHAHIKS